MYDKLIQLLLSLIVLFNCKLDSNELFDSMTFKVKIID